MTKPRILIIDDTPANLMTLGTALAGEFDLQISTSGAEGLNLATRSPPDLILLDIMMPEMDGYEVCRRLLVAPDLKDVPIIFVTALTETDAEVAGLALGAADYLTKPINVAVARQRIKNLLERERLRKEVDAYKNHLEELVNSRTAALSIAREAAEAASRAKTIFLANMSHELRTPMSGIMGLTGLALRAATDPRQLDQLGKVQKLSQNLLTLIDDILDISKIEAERLTLHREDFRLGEVFENVHSLIGNQAQEKCLALDFVIPEHLANQPVCGDPLRLGQILLNLAVNAVKFTTRGCVRIAAWQEGAIEDAMLTLRVEVTDTGMGIKQEDQDRIFHLFEQADASMTRKHGGSGLGLAICKRLIEMMGGSIGVKSESGAGSTFWFVLQLAVAGQLPLPAASQS